VTTLPFWLDNPFNKALTNTMLANVFFRNSLNLEEKYFILLAYRELLAVFKFRHAQL
jgi:hypothetical protein